MSSRVTQLKRQIDDLSARIKPLAKTSRVRARLENQLEKCLRTYSHLTGFHDDCID